jgi:outer membrane biosynthesis protein TonB
VPSGLPVVHLDGKSNIPTNLPLESIAKRFIVPRDINPEAYSVVEEPHALPPQPSELDQRITVPLGAASPEIIPPPQLIPTDMVEKNVFLTGEVNFLGDEEAAAKLYRKNLVDRAISVVVHATVILLLIFPPTFLRRHPPTPGELEIARKQMTLLLPPGAFEMSRPEPRATPPPRVKVDPRVLRKIAPPEPVPEPAPQPKTPARELPSAPTVKPEANQPPPAPTPKSEAPPNHAPKLETPDAPTTKPNLILPKNISPGRSIEDSLRSSASAKANAPQAMGGGGQLPGSGVPRSGGQGTAYGNLEMLTPTEGVDFRDYLHRVYITVKRNWFAVMPESVNLGEKGVVSLQFKIMRDGSVPGDEPAVLYTSQKEPLDRAAVSSIRSSNPFESLPPAFKGPYIELRFTYYYNLVPSNGPP